jgi:hypothetical protein
MVDCQRPEIPSAVYHRYDELAVVGHPVAQRLRNGQKVCCFSLKVGSVSNTTNNH